MAKDRTRHRLERSRAPTLSSHETGWRPFQEADGPPRNAVVDCGWGRLIFGQTFDDPARLARTLCQEAPGRRDIALYLRDPQVVISLAPQEVFLDPSHTYRLWLERYRAPRDRPKGFVVRVLRSPGDADAIRDLYRSRQMVPAAPEFVWEQRRSRRLVYFVAESKSDGHIIGVVTGVDHHDSFGDPELGSSLWALAVDAQASQPGVGEALTRQLAEHFLARGRSFLDLSVLHDNEQAIALYEKLGFQRVPVFALKHKNPYNEPLFIGTRPEAELNPYAQIIVTEARRRGIGVEVLDAEGGFFSLNFGGRSIVCRESLSELTTAVAMSRCDDKAVTHQLLQRVGLRVPRQVRYESPAQALDLLGHWGSLVVKPARGEQGAGISVDVRSPQALEAALESARQIAEVVLLEEFVSGIDLRIVVIDFQVVAAATRRQPEIVGDGRHTIEQLIDKQSRRRQAATGGESHIPLDAETRRCIVEAGHALTDVLPAAETLVVRKTANLHTGGTIHDVTGQISDTLRDAAEQAARALDIPVTGLDFIVPDLAGDDYVIIEANERPGLANHQPQPTAERFIDLLFPQTTAH